MALADTIAAVMFGVADPPAVLRVGLWDGDRELADGGYVRATVRRGAWRVAGGRARVLVRFGPFDGPVSVTHAQLLDGDEVLRREPFDGEMRLLAGMTLEHSFAVDVTDVSGG